MVLERGSKVLNVFLVAHTHLDPGWLNTVDEYYQQRVKGILEYVTTELWNDRKITEKNEFPQRKFAWSEVVYLAKWFEDYQVDDALKEKFSQLVEERQIEIVGGGWV